MARIFKPLSDGTQALAGIAQPVIIAMSTAGLTGGVMAAAGMLAGRMVRRG
jgi:hypothetical protein